MMLKQGAIFLSSTFTLLLRSRGMQVRRERESAFICSFHHRRTCLSVQCYQQNYIEITGYARR